MVSGTVKLTRVTGEWNEAHQRVGGRDDAQPLEELASRGVTLSHWKNW